MRAVDDLDHRVRLAGCRFLFRFDGAIVSVPRHPGSRPRPEFLAELYELFRRAG